MKKIIHVDQRNIRSNIKGDSPLKPIITVKASSKTIKCFGVDIKGGSKIIYSPHKPLSCGARLWIETMSTVDMLDKEGNICESLSDTCSNRKARLYTRQKPILRPKIP